MAVDPSERRARRARAALSLAEVLHYVLGTLGLIVSVPILGGGITNLLGGVGRWGVVSWRDADRCLTGLLIVAYAWLTLRSASRMGRRRGRTFSLRWAAAHAVTIVALPLAFLTWLVLTRESVKELYESRVLPFEPRILPPALPVPVVPLEATAGDGGSATS